MKPIPSILHEDAHCLAVDKPAGLLVQPHDRPSDEETLESVVRRYLDPVSPSSVYLGIVHRLDRPVSGVVLWAKTPKAARRLADQFANRQTVKEYRAAVVSRPSTDSGVWVDWLKEDVSGTGRVQTRPPETPRARRAVTRFRVDGEVSGKPGVAILTLWPETGRTHQLRVQTSSRGLAILGDSLYGSTETFPRGIALHAAGLTVTHPTTGQPLKITARLPDSWSDAGLVDRGSTS